ncbi:hypothetical protein L7F22_038807 [Adiantum nelumboides]|nr:hypothetical protein [Adiantum nelumboides]
MAVPVTEPASANLVTASTHSKPKYHLMELNADLTKLIEDISKDEQRQKRKRIREGDEEEGELRSKPTLCIKGRKADEAVLCTDTQTFMIRQVTQSNSLLLCSLEEREPESSTANVSVRDNIVEILELVPIVARVSRLTSLLENSAYSGEDEDEEEDEITKKRYTPQQVASIVQASPLELKKGFKEAHILELDGHLRMISNSYLFEALRTLLAHIDRLSLSTDRILLQPAVAALRSTNEMRKEVAEEMLRSWFGNPMTNKEGDDSTDTITQNDIKKEEEIIVLDTLRISQFIGLQLLETHAKGKPMEMETFTGKWKDGLGATLGGSENALDINLLQGNYLLTPAPPLAPSKLQPLSIEFFAASSLPLDISSRFQRLFSIRSQWIGEDLKPFLQDVAVDAKKRDALLLKFARSSQVKIPIQESKQDRRARLMAGNPHAPTKNVSLYSARLRY